MEISQLHEMFPKIELDIIHLLVQEYNHNDLLDILLELSKDEEELNYVRNSYTDINNTQNVSNNNNNQEHNNYQYSSYNEYDYPTEQIESEFPNTSLIPDNSDEGVGYSYPKEKKKSIMPSISKI